MTRRLLLVRCLAVLALVGAGCGSSDEDVERVRAVLAPVEEQIQELPGVVHATADVQYITGFEDHEVIDVEVITDRTTMEELVRLGEAATELVWHAPLEVIEMIQLTVWHEDAHATASDGDRLRLNEQLTRDELEQAFGPRLAGD